MIEADTGREALELAPSADLILLDVNLPDITGFDVCRQIKTDPRTAAIPVIQVSATAVAVADRAHGLTQGADAYLTDPSEPDELLAVVAAVLRYYRARRRAEQTASMLAALTRATLAINAADTFDGLARAAATGAARIFGVEAVLHPADARRSGPPHIRLSGGVRDGAARRTRRPGGPGHRAGARRRRGQRGRHGRGRRLADAGPGQHATR